MRLFPVLLLSVAACGTRDRPSGAPASDSVLVAAQLPGLTFHLDSGAIADSSIRLRTFGFRSTRGDWPVGGGIAVFTRAGNLAWIHLANGDLRPHSIGLADFDGDGRSDIFYYAGHEETLETTVLLNRIARDSFAISSFAVGYRDDGSYDAVLDLDGDRKPELLIPGRQAAADEESDAPGCADGLFEPPLQDQVRAEYFRLAGRFDSLNFKYGLPSQYPQMNLFLLDSVRILSLTTPDRLVTGRFRAHLDWRIGILKRLRETNPPECHRRLDDLVAYLTSPP